jgi:diguanylate cyclase (GGDEF)-like protein/PAS domain S-box-containing protein
MTPPHDLNVGDAYDGERPTKPERQTHGPWMLAFEAGHYALWSVDLAQGRFECSERQAEMLGLQPSDLEGPVLRLLKRIHKCDRRKAIAALRKHLGGDPIFESEHRILHADGKYRTFHARGRAQLGQDGRPELLVGTQLDITDQRQAEAALRRSEARLGEAQALANIGSWEADHERRMWLTPQMSAILGFDSSVTDAQYEQILELVHDDDVDALVETLAKAMEQETTVQVDYRVVRPNGEIRYVMGQAKPWKDDDGRVRLLGTAQDVTDGVTAAQTLQKAEAQFRAAVEASFDAILLLRSLREAEDVLDFEIAELNENAERMLDVPRAQVLGERLTRAVPSFELDGTLTRYVRVAETNVPLDIEFSRANEDGSIRWIHEQVVPIPGGVAVTHADITDRKLAEVRLRESELFTHRVTTSTPDWVFIYDILLDQTTYVNREPLRDLGYSSREVAELGRDGFFKVVHPDDRDALEQFRASHLGENEVGEFTYRLRSASGVYRWVSTRCVPFQQDLNGTPTQVLATTRDVTPQKLTEERLHLQMRSLNEAQIELQRRQNELEQLNDRLATLATRDGLTGLHNHRSLQDRLSEEISRAERTARPVSLIMVDVDRFKSYNDRYGHPAGDVVLRELANVLAVTARASDFVARYGGEEFAVLLPDSRAPDAAYLAERMRHKLNEAFFGEEKVTASFGCAEYIPGVMTKAELILEADRALYRAKRDGRDCVRVAEIPAEGEA